MRTNNTDDKSVIQSNELRKRIASFLLSLEEDLNISTYSMGHVIKDEATKGDTGRFSLTTIFAAQKGGVNLQLRTIDLIARALDTSIAQLFMGEELPPDWAVTYTEEDWRKHVASRIRAEKKARQWTGHELASELNISIAQYNNMVAATTNFRIDTLASIADGLNLPITDFLFGPFPETENNTDDIYSLNAADGFRHQIDDDKRRQAVLTGQTAGV